MASTLLKFVSPWTICSRRYEQTADLAPQAVFCCPPAAQIDRLTVLSSIKSQYSAN